MILICNIFHDSKLLRHFLHYYYERGVTRFIFNVWSLRSRFLWDEVAEIAVAFPATLVPCDFLEFSGEADSLAADSTRIRFVPERDWYAICDLDEFHSIPGYRSFVDATRAAEAGGADVIHGVVVDRIARDGSLPQAIDNRSPLGAQFPYACDITANVLHACTQKVLLAKGKVPISPGHHTSPGQVAWATTGESHHFKWMAGMVDEQKRRAVDYLRQGLFYQPESERLLAYLAKHNGKIPIDDPILNLRIVQEDPIHGIPR